MDTSHGVSGVIFIALTIFALLRQTTTCGPGVGFKSRPTNLNVRKRQPDVVEDNKAASGPFTRALLRNDSGLEIIISTQIVFADTAYEANCRKSTVTCKKSLLRLVDVVNTHWARKYKLRVKEGYMESKDLRKTIYRKDTLHLEGRAFDLELTAGPRKKRSIQRSSNKLALDLPTLAGLAYYEAGFSFVEVKEHHIHVSCAKKERQSAAKMFRDVFSRCFPATAYVRNKRGEKILMRDVAVGEEVLTIDSTGKVKYSEVSMIMHRETNVTVNDYIEISTQSGQTIILSSHHLIPISKSNSTEPIFIFSKNVRLADYIISYDNTKSTINKSRVISVNHVTRIGEYAPLSLEGTLVVNDVHVSCYAMFPNHAISHYAFSIWRTLYKILSPLLKFSTNAEGIHWYPNILRTAINWLPVLPYSL